MRLPSHKLPKSVRVKPQTAKHKNSIAHIEDHKMKKERKLLKENEMDTESVSGDNSTPKEKKVKDKSRTDWKRKNRSITDRRGPRAV